MQPGKCDRCKAPGRQRGQSVERGFARCAGAVQGAGRRSRRNGPRSGGAWWSIAAAVASSALRCRGGSGAAEPADLNNDGHVDGADLAMLLNQWGTNGTADLDHDSLVGGSDLAILLNAWG